MVAPQFIKVELDKRSLAYIQALEKSLGKEALYAQLDRFFAKQSLIAAGHISRNMLSGQRLARRTGQLARSIAGAALRVDGVPAMRVGVFRGPALKYAGVQEFGTKGKNPDSPYPTIRPRSARALAIPQAPEAVTPAGVDRFGGPRGFPGELHFVPFRDSGVSQGAIGGLYSDREYDIGIEFGFDRAKVAYLLVAKVDLEPKYYLRDGFRSYLPMLSKELAELLADLVRGGQAA